MSKVPINPEILKWAREELNMGIDEVARRMKKDIEDIEKWELGIDYPTYAQMEKLAYDIYKIPLAVFFFPEHPDLGHTQKSFRTLSTTIYNALPSNIIKLFRKAEVLKENLSELNDEKNDNYIGFMNKLKGKEYTTILQDLRNILKVPLDEQKGWKNSTVALEKWRNKFEEVGIYIFKDAFKDDAYSGFCLYDKQFPIIYINNTMAINRQIFTIFHEFWHIYSKTSGIDNKNDDESYLESLDNEGKNIEIICNKFAGDFLVPQKDFDKVIKNVDINEENISKLAELYKVSREVIARKCLDNHLINNMQYNEYVDIWFNDIVRSKENGNGGNYYNTIITYLGDGYLEKAYNKYYKNQINEAQLADYLNVKRDSLLPLEGKLSRRWQDG